MLDMPRRWRLIAPFAVGSIALVAGLAAYLLGMHHTWSPTVPGASQMAFVDDRSCAQCHQAQYRAWAGSHHDRAMQRADERAVLGDFNDARFTHLGVTSRFFKRDGRFFVNTAGADGTLADFEITHTLGVAPLQQYLIGFPGGRLQSFTMAWDTGKQRWLPLYTNETIAPGKPLHWTGRYQNWNLMCAECHTTNLRKGYDPSTDSYRTTWSALNVGCQACHGPGEAHLAWAQAGTRAKAADDTGLLVNFRTNDSRYQVDACARCHARRTRLVAGDRPGRPLLDDFRPELLAVSVIEIGAKQLGPEVVEQRATRTVPGDEPSPPRVTSGTGIDLVARVVGPEVHEQSGVVRVLGPCTRLRPGQVRFPRPVTGLAADVEGAPRRPVRVGRGIVALSQVRRVALGAHQIPVLITARPVQGLPGSDRLVRVEGQPALLPGVPGHGETLQPTAGESDQILLERRDAERVRDLEIGERAVGARGVDEESSVPLEEARCHSEMGEPGVIEVAQHRALVRSLHRPVMVRARPRAVLGPVTLGA